MRIIRLMRKMLTIFVAYYGCYYLSVTLGKSFENLLISISPEIGEIVRSSNLLEMLIWLTIFGIICCLVMFEIYGDDKG